MISTLPEEYKAEAIVAMGEELGGLYIQLIEELLTLHIKWMTFSQFFRVNEERVNVLSESISGVMTDVIADSMLDSVLLSISYLGDTNSKAFKLERFKKPLKKNDASKKIQNELDDLILLARETSRDLRNNHIAHHNYALYSSDNRDFQYPLYKSVDEILDKSQAFINDLALLYGMAPFCASYPTYEGKVSGFFYLLSGDKAKDEKFGLKLLKRSNEELKHLKPILNRFQPNHVYTLIDDEALRNGITDKTGFL